MRTIEEAREWYQNARRLIRLMRRIADRYWQDMPKGMWKDEWFKTLDSSDVTRMADSVLAEFEDLGVFLIFSAFEAHLRNRVRAEMLADSGGVSHPGNVRAVTDAIEKVEEGSFSNNVLSIWKDDHPDVTEMVNQVRRYRNWVAHGRQTDKKGEIAKVEPKAAFDRLDEYLRLVLRTDDGETTPPGGGSPGPDEPTPAAR